MGLSDQKCEACESGTQAVSQEEAQQTLKQLPGWELKGDKIERALKFADFMQTMRFANRIALIAEEENHHPDLHISYGKMIIDLSTHSVGGLSRNDFILAAKINDLVSTRPEPQAI